MSERHERFIKYGISDGSSVDFERHERFTKYEISSSGVEDFGEEMIQQTDA